MLLPAVTNIYHPRDSIGQTQPAVADIELNTWPLIETAHMV